MTDGCWLLLLLTLMQAGDVGWSPSLLFLPAAGLVAGRAIKVLTTLKVCMPLCWVVAAPHALAASRICSAVRVTHW
jgi:hypothetical protein